MSFSIELSLKGKGYPTKKVSLVKGQAKVVQLELGESLDAIKISESGEFRIQQETQTSVTLMNEGPHIDLVNWIHGRIQYSLHRMKSGAFRFNDAYKSVAFPKVSGEQIAAAVSEVKGIESYWVQHARTCTSANTYPCNVGPSLYRFFIEKKIGGQWYLIGTVDVEPPMGC